MLNVYAELPTGSRQRALTRSVSHPSYRALFANSRDQKQRNNQLVSRTSYSVTLFVLYSCKQCT